MVDPSPSSSVMYRWNTAGCYTNSNYNRGSPRCFPHGETTQSVSDNDVTAEDAGAITCTVTSNSVQFTSGPLTIHVSGMYVITNTKCIIECNNVEC